MLSFFLFTVLLSVGVSIGVAAPYLTFSPSLIWTAASLVIGISLGLLVRFWGWRSLLLAVPLSVVLAHAVTDKIWPRHVQQAPLHKTASLKDAPQPPEPKNSIERETILLQVPERFRRGAFDEDRHLEVPRGFTVSVFAAGLKGPRFMAFDPNGRLYVSQPRTGEVLVLPDEDKDGAADRTVLFAKGLDSPHGLAFRGRDLYVAETGRLMLLRDQNGDLAADSFETVSEDIPAGGGHWTRSVVLGPDERLYVSAGSTCNACIEDDRRRAAVLRFALTGGEAELFAFGLRNSVGLAFHPETGELWASENGRDHLGDDLPPEEINRIVEKGDYGWPFCYGRQVSDPDFGTTSICADTLPPEVEMQAHSAPLGIAFGHGLKSPPFYRDMLYVAFHGSWNRTVPTGYKLVGIPFEGGRPTGPAIDIVSGWLLKRSAWGRPVAPVVGPDGALYLSDDRAGAIYRICAPAVDF